MEDEDDDEVLAWKTLEDPDEHQHHHHSHHHSSDHAHVHAHGGGIPSGTDDDVEDFAELAYEHEHERTPMTTVGVAAGDAHPPHSLLQLQQHERHASHSHHSHHHGQHRAQQQRLKRKNFSKQLQLLCLQRYAQYAKEHGKLPDKTECQLLLNQSYLQFLKDGGAPDEPRLTHQEFLKLIRNRRREMYVRAQKLKFPHVSSSSANASTFITTSGDTGADSEAAAPGGITSQPLSAAKRKLQQEHAKIYELIEIIDQAREQSGLVSDHNHNRQSVRVPQSSQRSGKRRLNTKSAPSQQQQSTVHEYQQHHHHHHHQQQQQQLVADPQDQICAIFRIQQEMLEIQREIAERLKVIRLHRSLQQHDPMEPSSASV